MITTSEILDAALSMTTDNSSGVRARMLSWLNLSMQELAKMRPWSFLNKQSTLTLTNGYSIWPADFQEPVSWTIGSTCIYPSARLSDKDLAENRYGGQYGYRVSDNPAGFTVYPSADSCLVKYKMAVPTYADGDTTLFPIEMKNVFVRKCITCFYEYDSDDRAVGSMNLYMQALKEAKKWDNLQNPLPKAERRSIQWRNS